MDKKKEKLYEVGDWIVHRRYGVGKVLKIEMKPLGGDPQECYQVKTKNSTYWFPTDQDDNPRIRPVATPSVIEDILEILQRDPKKLETDNKIWKTRISNIQSDGELVAISRFIRDLYAKQALKKLTQTEESALNRYMNRLLREWSAITGDSIEDIEPKIEKYLKKQLERAETMAA